MKQKELKKLNAKIKAASDITRMTVLIELNEGPKMVAELLKAVNKGKQKIQSSLLSHHLDKLKKEGFVTSKHRGKPVEYSKAKECIPMADLMKVF